MKDGVKLRKIFKIGLGILIGMYQEVMWHLPKIMKRCVTFFQ